MRCLLGLPERGRTPTRRNHQPEPRRAPQAVRTPASGKSGTQCCSREPFSTRISLQRNTLPVGHLKQHRPRRIPSQIFRNPISDPSQRMPMASASHKKWVRARNGHAPNLIFQIFNATDGESILCGVQATTFFRRRKKQPEAIRPARAIALLGSGTANRAKLSRRTVPVPIWLKRMLNVEPGWKDRLPRFNT